MTAQSIAAINRLPEAEKREIYARFIPNELLKTFGITGDLLDDSGRSLAEFKFAPGSTDLVVELRDQVEAEDPLLYAHLTDTMNGQIHVLLYVVNDPGSERFDVDRMPDGRRTQFGLKYRNLVAEKAAMEAGLAPGQVRRGLRLLSDAIPAFEEFVESLGHSVFFIEPLFYHNAVIFERYGFDYSQGRRRMKKLNSGFGADGRFTARLDGSSAFRAPGSERSIRGRSWAIHDGVSGDPYNGVTMYKRLGNHAAIATFPNAIW